MMILTFVDEQNGNMSFGDINNDASTVFESLESTSKNKDWICDKKFLSTTKIFNKYEAADHSKDKSDDDTIKNMPKWRYWEEW